MKITVLEHNLNQEDPGQFSVEAVKVTKHPGYRPSSSPPVNDIAVLEISPSLDWRTGARPVCWGPSSPSPPSSLVYTAWGRTQFGLAAVPQEVSLPLTDTSASCEARAGQLCAGPGSSGQQPCQVANKNFDFNLLKIFIT